MKELTAKPSRVYIYCRVSSERQVTEGDGLNSQESRCRQFAQGLGLSVDRVFKEEGLSGALHLEHRPALLELFQEVERQPPRSIVIVDDISRLARDMGAYTELRLRLRSCHAEIMAPNMKFGDSPEDQVFEHVSMAFAQYHRQSNARQVKSRQKARLENGFWPFHYPLGYQHVKDPTSGGKVLQRVEPIATIIGTAFEGFAAGRFETQIDVANFFTRTGRFALGKKGIFNPSSVKAILTNPIYAGYIEFPAWGVSMRQGQHDPVTDLKTFQRVQERLGMKAKAPYRKDLNEGFPLRGFVLCPTCNTPLTASWSTARNGKKHPYYRCKTHGCALYGKSLRKESVEGKMEELLQKIAPSKEVLALAEAIVRDTHRRLQKEHTSRCTRIARDIEENERQKDGFLKRLLDTEKPTLIQAYENQIEKLEQRRFVLIEDSQKMQEVDTDFDSSLGTVFDFLGNPYAIWKNGDLEEKRMVLKMAFVGQLPFDKEEGFGTTLTSLPFSIISTLSAPREAMVEGGGFEPPYS